MARSRDASSCRASDCRSATSIAVAAAQHASSTLDRISAQRLSEASSSKVGKARVVPRVRNACAGNNVIGVTATLGRALGDLVRAHSRKTRLQLFAVPVAQCLAIGCGQHLRRSLTGERCFVISFT